MILESIFIAGAFALWGHLLSHVITQVDMILSFLPRMLPHRLKVSKPVWSCAVCAAGFQCYLYIAALFLTGWIGLADLPIFSLAPVFAMAGAYFLEKE